MEERIVEFDSSGKPDLAQLREYTRGDGDAARLLVLPHASNVTGTVLPVREMAEIAHEWGTLVLLDAAQTAGHYPVDVRSLDVDLMAFSGHKGIPGPQGIGGLWVREGVEVDPLVHGGTGGDSALATMPRAYPDHLEAGTQNSPGIAGLAAATEWVLGRGVETLHGELIAMKHSLVDRLARIPGVDIRSLASTPEVAIVTLLLEGMDPGDLASELDRRWGIQSRAGLHCAPGAHEAIGTLATGALRLSPGWATTGTDIDHAVAAIVTLSDEMKGR